MLIAGSAVAVALMTAAAGASTSTDAPAGSGEVLLVATGDPDAPFAFEPAELTVEPGTTVHWRNETGDVFHTVTFADSLDRRVANGRFDAALFAEGDVATFTFTEPGTYPYFCQPHAEFMAATVVVTEPGGAGAAWAWWVGGVGASLALVALAVLSTRRARRKVAGL